jgi:Ca-activated chloride channel family protein
VNTLAAFHFLRPEWLWLLLPAGLLAWRLHLQQSQRDDWDGVIAPHLLQRLRARDDNRAGKWRPAILLPIAWLTGILALAGPAWQREASPFSQDQSAAVIVLRVSPEMMAMDIAPSRLQRANHKIRDLLELRAGTRNALVAYYGSAHMVMPLTRDPDVIGSFAAGLEPGIMPLEGDAVVEALTLANDMLTRDGATGSIILVTDAIDPAAQAGLQAIVGADVHMLAVAAGPEAVPPVDSPPAPPLDTRAMQASADTLGASLTKVSVDDADVRRLNRLIETSFVKAPPTEGERWRDQGWWLLLPLAGLTLMFFRPGGAVPVR